MTACEVSRRVENSESSAFVDSNLQSIFQLCEQNVATLKDFTCFLFGFLVSTMMNKNYRLDFPHQQTTFGSVATFQM